MQDKETRVVMSVLFPYGVIIVKQSRKVSLGWYLSGANDQRNFISSKARIVTVPFLP